MHNKMTRAQYQARLEQYAGTYRLVHLDSYADGGDTYYAGIWWQQPGPAQAVRSNRDWYLFQRFHDNHACQGAVLDNVVVANVEGAVRYGGIWTATGAPNVGPGSPVAARIAQEVNCAPGRAGAAVINVTTGEQVMVGADDSYGTSSTIKSAILYALLRRIDATAANLTTLHDVEGPFGSNVSGQDMVAADQRVHPRRPRHEDDPLQQQLGHEPADPVPHHGRDQRPARRPRAQPDPAPPLHDGPRLAQCARQLQRERRLPGWLGQHRHPAAVRTLPTPRP